MIVRRRAVSTERSPRIKSIAACAIGGGHGDRIMATGGDPDRPGYILSRTPLRDRFNLDFRVVPGRVAVSDEMASWARGAAPAGLIMIEPHVKGRHSADNKDWGWHKWLALATATERPLLQCQAPGRRPLPRAQVVETPSFEHAVAVLAQSAGIVTTEGGLHHAAAALGRPAVVIFGAFNLPSMFAYDGLVPGHVSVWEPDPEGLGRRRPHPACRAAMERIGVDRVLEAMERAFGPT